MTEKKIYILIAIILLLTSVFAIYKTLNTDPFAEMISTQQSGNKNNRSQLASITNNLPIMRINDKEIFVEIANDNQLRAKGLSGRESLPPNQGMLFVYDIANLPAFWMYDMRIDLDMIWINNNQVVDITRNVPAPEEGTPTSELPQYYPSQSVNAILEVNAGFAEKNNIQIGDAVTLPQKLEN